MKIKEIQDQIVEEFDIFDSWMDKYEYLIELGKSVPVIDDINKTDDNIIKGCQSKVWLHAQENDGIVETETGRNQSTENGQSKESKQ